MIVTGEMIWAEKVFNVRAELLKGSLTLKDVDRVLRQLFADIAEEALHGRRVGIPNFGVFLKKTRRARQVRNPQTHELMRLPRAVSVGFRCSKAIKR